MARGKKKEELSLEEKLEQALVPVEEQPYEVPGNWCWVYLKNIAQWGSGGTPSRKNATFYNGNIPWVKTGELEDDYLYDTEEKISEEAIKKSSAKLFPVGAVLIAMYGATIGKTAILGNEATTNQACACAVCNSSVYNKYLFYYLRSRKDKFIEQGKGGAQPNISQDIIKKNCIPLPPKAEQQRIVEQIEKLFAKLDEVKEKAQTIVDGFELRKSAILYKALRGELTERWRKEHGVGLDSWKHCTVGSVCNDVKVGIVIKPSQYYTDKNEGTPAFRSANVRECRVDDFDWVYLNEEGMVNNKRSIVHTGDVLIVRSGNPGTACVVADMFDGYNAIDILIAVPNRDFVLPDFLCLFTNSPLGKKSVAEGKRGMALSHFNVKGYSKVEFDVPLIPEQKEIIHALNKFLEKEKQVKEAAEAVLNQVDTMKKAILFRAFCGKLGTNDAMEESAVEMLKKIL